jgi:hypothetical protein
MAEAGVPIDFTYRERVEAIAKTCQPGLNKR